MNQLKNYIYFASQSTLQMLTKRATKLLTIGLLLVSISSCRLFDPTVMIKSKRDYPYATQGDTVPRDYIIQPGDIINFRLFSNQGFKIIDLTSLDDGSRMTNNLNQGNMFVYLVEADSSLNLPIVGRTKIAGLNLKEAELFLEDKYANYYNDPFVMLRVNNRRVVVFPGAGGAARVVPLENEYTTVIEALALAGGISERGKAHKIKIVRGSLNNPEIYWLDLSSAEGLKAASVQYVRANDIIYVEPSYFAGRQILQTTSQVLGVVSSLILTYFLIMQFQNSSGV